MDVRAKASWGMCDIHTSQTPFGREFTHNAVFYNHHHEFRFKKAEEKAEILCVRTRAADDKESFFYIIENEDCSTSGAFDALGEVYDIGGEMVVHREEESRMVMD